MTFVCQFGESANKRRTARQRRCRTSTWWCSIPLGERGNLRPKSMATAPLTAWAAASTDRSTRQVPVGVVGYEDLDANGRWIVDAS